MNREKLTFERVDALLDMIASDGATPGGSMPPAAHVEALRKTRVLGESREVRDAHENGAEPPDFVARHRPEPEGQQ